MGRIRAVLLGGRHWIPASERATVWILRSSLGRFLGFKIACSICRSLLSPPSGRSSDRLVSESGFPPAFPGRKTILKLNLERNSGQRVCQRFSSFVDIKYSEFLWSDKN